MIYFFWFCDTCELDFCTLPFVQTVCFEQDYMEHVDSGELAHDRFKTTDADNRDCEFCKFDPEAENLELESDSFELES